MCLRHWQTSLGFVSHTLGEHSWFFRRERWLNTPQRFRVVVHSTPLGFRRHSHMSVQRRPYTILLVEDDENDAFLFKLALERAKILNPVQWLKDGIEAIAYLTGESPYTDRTVFPQPELVILDLKMPRMSGLELLAWLRDHPAFQGIPIIIMSSSMEERDVRRAYNLGANTYFVKPGSFDIFVTLIGKVHAYWESSIITPRGPRTDPPPNASAS